MPENRLVIFGHGVEIPALQALTAPPCIRCVGVGGRGSRLPIQATRHRRGTACPPRWTPWGAQSTNRIYRQQKVDVFEVRNGWARVSKFYDGSVEGVSGEVARWVLAAHLGKQRPADLPQPKVDRDPRIAKDAIPKVGDSGLTESDVRVLHRGAKHYLDNGRCARVEFADKSTSKPNTYYVNCGGSNLFFTPADLPAE